jgi:hypothetical protein
MMVRKMCTIDKIKQPTSASRKRIGSMVIVM